MVNLPGVTGKIKMTPQQRIEYNSAKQMLSAMDQIGKNMKRSGLNVTAFEKKTVALQQAMKDIDRFIE